MRRLFALLARDFRLEMRTREVVTGTLLFAAITVMILSFGLADSPALLRADVRAALLWIAFSFAGTLGLSRALARERESGALGGLLLAPIDWSLIYVAKLLSTFVITLGTELLTLGLFVLFAGVHFPQGGLAALIGVIAGVTFGHLALGMILAAVTLSLRAREVLLFVLVFPLLIPLFLAAIEATRAILATPAGGVLAEGTGRWLGLIAAFDAVYLALGLALFPIILRD